jgi:hypothetical protein
MPASKLLCSALLATTVLVARPAQASSFYFGDEHFCSWASWVFVGTVAESSGRLRDPKERRGLIVTDLTLTVEVVIHGSPPPSISITRPGGDYKRRSQTYSGTTVPSVGDRLVVFAHVGTDMKLHLAPYSVRQIGATASLPSAAELSQAWHAMCDAAPTSTETDSVIARLIRLLPDPP